MIRASNKRLDRDRGYPNSGTMLLRPDRSIRDDIAESTLLAHLPGRAVPGTTWKKGRKAKRLRVLGVFSALFAVQALMPISPKVNRREHHSIQFIINIRVRTTCLELGFI